MNRQSSCSKALISITLAAQRLNSRLPLPKAVRRVLRLLLARSVQDNTPEQGIEDWSIPLIARREGGVDQVSGLNLEGNDGHSEAGEPLNAADLVSRQLLNGREPTPGLRCLLVTDSLDVGGMDEVVVFLACGLRRQGISTAVLHASTNGTSDGTPTGRLGRLLLEQGVETVELTGSAGANWIETWQPDIISAHCAPVWVLELATRLSIPYVDTLHGQMSLYGKDQAAEIKRARELAGIVAVGNMIRRQYLDLNPTFSPERIITIPNCVDHRRRTPVNRDWARARWGVQDEYMFVSLGRHCLQKNTYGLVAGFADVAARHPEAHLVIAGRVDDATYFAQVQRLRDSLSCRDRIHLRDHFSDPAELLALADGFVLDSFFEAGPLVSMEALHAGVPVVISDVGEARDQVGDDETRGHVIPNPIGDPQQVNWESIRSARYVRQINREALVTAMSSLIVNRASWIAARERLMRESAERFHPDVCLRSYAQVLSAAAHGEELLLQNKDMQNNLA
jgi:glycosyltransferase involved in cell wall biosynthesis